MNKKNLRLIARLDVKGEHLIKTVHLEGLRVVGNPSERARKYYHEGADEIIYIDLVASLYNRNILPSVLTATASNVFVPITAGGGIRMISDVLKLLNSGADKVAVNTGIVRNPDLINEISNTFGSQCMVAHIEAKKCSSNKWEVFVDCAREPTGIDVIDWAKTVQDRGAGEILITSIDREGTRKGFDLELVQSISDVVEVPVICSGGYGVASDMLKASKSGADAIAFADTLHIQDQSFNSLRISANELGLNIREI